MGGVIRSTDNGQTWEQIRNGLYSLVPGSLVENSKNEMFISTSFGISVSTDNGYNWKDVSLNGSPYYSNMIGNLFVDKDDVLYFQNDNNMIYRGNEVKPASIEVITYYFQQNSDIFPNPASNFFSINLYQEKPNYLKLTLMNSIGNEIKVLDEQNNLCGRYSAKFTLDDIPTGLYFIRVQTGSQYEIKSLIVNR